MELTTAAYALWIMGLAVAWLCVPLLLGILGRISRSSARIAGYALTIREAGRGIAKNLEPIPALEKTAELLAAAGDVGGRLAEGSEALGAELRSRAGGGS